MAATANYFMPAILMLGLLLTSSLDFTVAQIGVAYGRNGERLPSPAQVVDLYKRNNIKRMRIYEPYQPVFDALRGSGIELTLSILNRDLPSIAGSQASADGWVRDVIVRNSPGVNFKHIVVGNEISPTSENSQSVYQAMQNVYNALSRANLANQIKVTTSIDTGLLQNSFPPEDGEFKPDAARYLRPIIRFLVEKGSPLLASIYPYFSYLGTPGMDINYALLQPNFPGIVTKYGNRYQNLFYALLDAVYAALEKTVGPSLEATGGGISTLQVGVTETGWPSNGGPPRPAGETAWPSKGGLPRPAGSANAVSNFRNAETYINNLIRVVKNGTPKRPNQPIETHIFAMFDENQKPGREDERHFGLFTADGRPKYRVNFG